MTQKQAPKKEFVVPGAPAIPGLRFRSFSGEADFPAIVAIVTKCNEADGLENTIDVIGNNKLWYNVHSYPAFLAKE